MQELKLSEMEQAALNSLRLSDTGRGRPISEGDLPERNGLDLWGMPVPGRRVWMGLVRKGHVLIPEEEPIDLGDGEMFTFTAFLELTEEGRSAAASCRGSNAI